MGFLDANYITFIKKYATFSGRASRSEFWWFRLSYLIISRAFSWGIPFLLLSNMEIAAQISQLQLYAFCIAFDTLLIIPFMAVTSRRLHDRDMSGMWSIIIIMQASLTYYPLFMEVDPLSFKVIMGISVIAMIALHIVLMFSGTTGSNKYGPDPLRPKTNADIFA